MNDIEAKYIESGGEVKLVKRQFEISKEQLENSIEKLKELNEKITDV